MAKKGERGRVFNRVKAGTSRMRNAAEKTGSRVVEVAAEAGSVAAGVAANAAKGAYAAFGGEVAVEVEGNLCESDGSYIVPEPVLSDNELAELDPLGERWSKATKPGMLAKISDKAANMLPQVAQDALSNVAESIDGLGYYTAALEMIGKGFGVVESHAAKMSVSSTYVINRVNQGVQEQKVSDVSEICLLRSYDVARIAGAERAQHLMLALTEGAATGAPGFPGIPFNIVLSLFLFFRAVQSIAMFYGYDVKADPGEMVIAGDVLMAAFGGAEQGPNGSVTAGAIGKVMAISEAETVRQVVSKGWTAAASHGGIPLLIAQMRALAHKSAEKAVINAGQKTLEESVFANVFKQVGKRLSQNAVKNAIPYVSGVIGALFDTGLMEHVLTVADLFYHKRFVVEKPTRVQMLTEGVTFEEAACIGDEDESDA